jgi:hypothetical protein
MLEREAQRGRRVATVLTGGNLDTALLRTIFSGATPEP